MAKKKTTKSSRTKAPSSRSKKTTKKKATTKKVTKKVAKKKSTTKKAPPKKVTKKKTAKKAPAKKVAKKKTTKKAPAKKVAKKTTKKKVTKTVTKKVAKTVTKKVTKPTPIKPNGPAPDSIEAAMEKEWTIPQLKRVKTGLKKKDLEEFLKMLLEKRAEIVGNVQSMEDARNAALGDIAHMPLHMADVGSDNFEQEFTLGLMESERERLREIDAAILRMREGYYGVCLESGRPIQRLRLEFEPWARYCIDVARVKDKTSGW